MTLIPAGPRVLIVDPPAETEQGLILPEGVRPTEVGIVKAVGDDCRLALTPGDRVHYHVGHCLEFPHGEKIVGEDCIVAYEHD